MGVAVTPDGQRVVSTSGDNTLKVWDINSGRELATLVGHSGVVEGVAVTPDGERIVSASLDTTLKVWDLESGTIIAEFYCEGMARACGYSKIYHSYIAGDASGRIYILHLEGIS
jgi:WD40 repeat protein